MVKNLYRIKNDYNLMLKGWWKVSVRSSTLKKLEKLKITLNKESYDSLIDYLINFYEKSK